MATRSAAGPGRFPTRVVRRAASKHSHRSRSSRSPAPCPKSASGTERQPRWREALRPRNPRFAISSSSCWPRCASRSTPGGWRRRKRTRARRALDLAERVFDAYQTRQKEDLAELLKQISCRVATDLLGAPSGRGPRCGERRAVDGQGRRAGDRVLRIAPAPSSRRAERVAPELARDCAVSGHGGELQRADRVPAAGRRDQQLRRRASRAARRAAGRRVLPMAAHRAHPRPAVLRAPEPPRPVLAEARVHVVELRLGPRTTQYETTDILRSCPRAARDAETSTAPRQRHVARSRNCCRRCARRCGRRFRSGAVRRTTSGRSASCSRESGVR